MSRKYALIIANTAYTDPGLAQLTAPGKDAEDFAQVLNAPDIGGFDEVQTFINPDNATAKQAIDRFFNEKKRDDLLVVYFSGHGVRDDDGSLYLAVKNTQRSLLDSTGIESVFIRRKMEKSFSKKQVLILDCCNSGAFAPGTKSGADENIGTKTAFINNEGSGQIILAASDKTQYAFEGDKVIGVETDNSLFTHYLVEGLNGEADHDGDGQITVTELYYYVSDHVKQATNAKQTPIMSMNRQEGEIFLRQGMPIKPLPLPRNVLSLLDPRENPLEIRLGAVQHLITLSNSKNPGLAHSAKAELQRLAKEDDSSTVKNRVRQALDALQQTEQAINQKSEIERIAAQAKAEADRFAAQKAEERIAKLEAERLAIQKTEEERVAKARLEEERQAKVKAKRLADEKFKAERLAKQKARIRINTQKVFSVFKSFFLVAIKGQKTSRNYTAIGAATLLFIVLGIFWSQLVYISSKSVHQESALYPITQGIQIKSTPDYQANSLLLPGMMIDIAARTTSVPKNEPCQVIIYFKHADNLITTSRTFMTILSPYISEGNYVSVFANITPSYDSSRFDIQLFIPFVAFANSGLSDGDYISYYADLYKVNGHSFIARSSTYRFKYTK